jgi:hypothetical protein
MLCARFGGRELRWDTSMATRSRLGGTSQSRAARAQGPHSALPVIDVASRGVVHSHVARWRTHWRTSRKSLANRPFCTDSKAVRGLEFPSFRGHLSAWSVLSDRAGRIGDMSTRVFRKPYPPEFRRDAVQLVRSSRYRPLVNPDSSPRADRRKHAKCAETEVQPGVEHFIRLLNRKHKWPFCRDFRSRRSDSNRGPLHYE